MMKFKFLNLHELSIGINNNTGSSLQEVMKRKPENIQQQVSKDISIKLQRNFTETTHQHGHSPTNSNTIDR